MPIKPMNMWQKAQRQEKDAARRLKGRITPGSGNGREKGDVRVSGIMRLECKSTEAKSFSITLEMWNKIETAAAIAGEIPALPVRFMHNGKTLFELAVVPMSALEALVDDAR